MTTPKTAIGVLMAVADIGGRLGRADGDRLRMLLPAGCPPELKDAIRQHKLALLELLPLNFRVVRSDALAEVVLWTPDEATKGKLIAAGADSGAVYTADELAQLVNRRVTTAELPGIHAAKRQFAGRINRNDQGGKI